MKRFFIGLLLISILIGGCSSNHVKVSSNQLEKEKPIVVATIFPLADLVRKIGGEEIEVITLLPAGASPHTFEPTPGAMKAISRSRLLVSVGAGLDLWGQGLARTTGADVREVVVTDTLTLLPLTEHQHGDHDGSLSQDNHQGGQGDPHVWLDPILVKEVIAPRITEALVAEWPELADTFIENLAALQQGLGDLDEELRLMAASFSHRKFISFHATWGYLAHRYGLQEVASVLEYPTQEPSARWLAELVEMAKDEQVKIIFIEPQFNPRPAELVAEEMGGQVFILDPLGGEGIIGRDSYFELMTYNFQVLKEALQ